MYREFFEFEEKNNLFNRKLDNFYYWEFLRRQILYDIRLTINKVELKKWKDKYTIKSRLINLKYFSRYIIKKTKKNIDILMVADPRRVLNTQGKYENIFIDNINLFLSKYYNTLILEEPSYRAWIFSQAPHLTPTISENIKYTDLLEFKFPFCRILLRTFKRKIYNQIVNEINEIIKLVKKKFKIDLTSRFSTYLYSLEIYYLLKKTYTKLIKKLNPKIVLFNYKPTEIKALLNYICKENKIPTVNMQHGIISDSSVEMKTGRKNLNVFPDYLFSFGEILTDCNDSSYDSKNTKYIGHPYLENKVKTNTNKPDFIRKDYKYILIVSQEILGNEFANFTSNLSDLLMKYPQYKIIYKYHPAECYKDYKQLKKENIIEIKNLKYDLYSLQKYSFMQVGSYSTGLYEGILFELPTVVINRFYGASDTISTLKFMKKGFYSVENADELSELILAEKIERPIKEDINKIWKNNSYENLLNEIINIIKEGI